MEGNTTIITTPLISDVTDPHCKGSAKLVWLEKLRLDGVAYYDKEKAKTFDAINAGLIDVNVGNALTELLEGVKNNLVTGDWLTALNIVNNTPTSLVFSAEYKTDIQTRLQEYINNNYQTW
jgi:hypothetical protein